MDIVDVIVDRFVHGFDPSGNEHLTAQLLRLMDAGQSLELFNQLHGLFVGDEFGSLHAVYQKLQLRQLKGPLRHIVAAVLSADQLDLHPELAQLLQIVVDALSFRFDAVGSELFAQLRHAQRMFLVGLPVEDLQKVQKFLFLVCGLCHRLTSCRSFL